MGIGKNTVKQTTTLSNGRTVSTIVDASGKNVGMIEIKDQLYVTRSTQLQAQIDLANKNGTPYYLVVSPNTERISRPLLDDIMEVNLKFSNTPGGPLGGVYVYNPATDTLVPWKF